jgi:hypothetical protein
MRTWSDSRRQTQMMLIGMEGMIAFCRVLVRHVDKNVNGRDAEPCISSIHAVMTSQVIGTAYGHEREERLLRYLLAYSAIMPRETAVSGSLVAEAMISEMSESARAHVGAARLAHARLHTRLMAISNELDSGQLDNKLNELTQLRVDADAAFNAARHGDDIMLNEFAQDRFNAEHAELRADVLRELTERNGSNCKITAAVAISAYQELIHMSTQGDEEYHSPSRVRWCWYNLGQAYIVCGDLQNAAKAGYMAIRMTAERHVPVADREPGSLEATMQVHAEIIIQSYLDGHDLSPSSGEALVYLIRQECLKDDKRCLTLGRGAFGRGTLG